MFVLDKRNVKLYTIMQICRMPVLEKTAKAVWEMILNDGGLGKEISETVERVYCRLSGLDVPPLPPPPPPTSDAQQSQKVKENREAGQKVKEIMSKSSSGKKAIHQLSMRRGEIVKKGFCDHPPVVLEDGAQSSNNSNV